MSNEVNAQDEADKYLRDHQPSELSQLRLQLADLTRDKERLEGELETMAQERIDQLTRDKERLRAALRQLRDCDWVITLPDRMDGVRKIASAAISEVEP